MRIIYENDFLIAVNKPRGLQVYDIDNSTTKTLVHMLGQYNPLLNTLPRCGLVNRLDKDTTGVILVAKSQFHLLEISAMLKNKDVIRKYVGIVSGTPKKAGVISNYLKKSHSKGKMLTRYCSGKGHYYAETHYHVIDTHGEFSLLEFSLQTGRTHQIRAHMKHLGHPIVGDYKYSSRHKIQDGYLLHSYITSIPKYDIEIKASIPDLFLDFMSQQHLTIK